MSVKLPNFEISIYYSIWIVSVLYSMYRFAISSQNFFSTYQDIYGDFKPGFIPFAAKDKADFEWETFLYLLRKIYLWILVYIIVSEVIRYKHVGRRVLQVWQCFISVIFVINSYGFKSLFVILLQPVLFRFFSLFHDKRTIWVVNILMLAFLNIFKSLNMQQYFFKHQNLNEFDVTIIILTLSWINLRCVSYILDFTNGGSFFDYLSYCLYLPTLFSGPFILYEDFEKTYETEAYAPLKKRLETVILNLLRCLFWMIFLEIFLHFIYVNATSFQPELVETFDFWSLCGYGYSMGQVFHIKYVVLYGLSTSIASFENIRTPSLPRCIGRIHLYSDMWKYFDPGLYSFLLKYIYVPVRSLNITQNKLFPSLICFLFVYIWHGVEKFVFVWASLNYIGVVMENFAKLCHKKYLCKTEFMKNIQPEWFRRISCILASPLLMMSAISNFYFLGNANVGNIFMHKVKEGGVLNVSTVLMVLYSCCQVSTELANVASHKIGY